MNLGLLTIRKPLLLHTKMMFSSICQLAKLFSDVRVYDYHCIFSLHLCASHEKCDTNVGCALGIVNGTQLRDSQGVLYRAPLSTWCCV